MPKSGMVFQASCNTWSDNRLADLLKRPHMRLFLLLIISNISGFIVFDKYNREQNKFVSRKSKKGG